MQSIVHEDSEIATKCRDRFPNPVSRTIQEQHHVETIRLGVIMNGVTGRMGTNQHLDPLDQRDPQAGRRRARRRHGGSCRIRFSSAATPRRSRRWRKRTASSAGRPISTPRSPTRTTRSISTARRRACARAHPQGDRRRQAHLHREAGRADASPTRSTSTGAPKAAGVKHGVVQDKLWLPGLAQAQDADRLRLLRPHPLGARRVRLLGVRGRLAAARSARRGTTARRTTAASSSTCCATGATCSTTCSAR